MSAVSQSVSDVMASEANQSDNVNHEREEIIRKAIKERAPPQSSVLLPASVRDQTAGKVLKVASIPACTAERCTCSTDAKTHFHIGELKE